MWGPLVIGSYNLSSSHSAHRVHDTKEMRALGASRQRPRGGEGAALELFVEAEADSGEGKGRPTIATTMAGVTLAYRGGASGGARILNLGIPTFTKLIYRLKI